MLKRGFKAQAERMAERYRSDLGLGATDPLCPWKLSEHLKVLVWSPHNIEGLSAGDLHQLLVADDSSWSAATLVFEDKTLVILNSSHSKPRQAHDLMHELSHLILQHEPVRVDITDDGLMLLKSYNKDQEDEADILAGVLLLPRAALIQIHKSGKSVEASAAEYGVSKPLLNMRLGTSGVKAQMARRNARFGY